MELDKELSSLPSKETEEWARYARSYLNLAELGLVQARPSSKDRESLIATVWNLKHAVELIFKIASLRIDGNHLSTHEFYKQIQDMLAKFGEQSPPLRKLINTVGEMYNKYIRFSYWDKRIPKGLPYDTKNEGGRYPGELSPAFSEDVLTSLSETDFQEIESDIQKARQFLERLTKT